MIQGLPLKNGANLPIFGRGPGAKGKTDDNGKNFRVCWPAKGDLSAESKQDDCGNGKKAAVCIWDQRLSATQLSTKREDFKAAADELLDGVPVFKISVGTGRCTTPKIADACKMAEMTPLCSNSDYAPNAGAEKCWQDDTGDLAKYRGKQFSLPSDNKLVGLDPKKLAGMCFSAGTQRGSSALYNTGKAQSWTDSTTTIFGDGKSWDATQQDQDGWFTWCISNEERELAAQLWEQKKRMIMGANMRRLAVTLAATKQGDVPVFKISVGKERCDSDKIADACKSKQMTPVCASPDFQRSKACWAATGKMS